MLGSLKVYKRKELNEDISNGRAPGKRPRGRGSNPGPGSNFSLEM